MADYGTALPLWIRGHMEKVEKVEINTPVVVAGLWYTGVVLMRCFARRGIPVYGFDSKKEHPGFATRYGKTFLCTSPDTDEQKWLEFMIRLSTQIGIKPVLMSAADEFTSAIGKHGETLAEHFIFRPHAYRLQALLATKEEQYRLAVEYGMPVASSRFAASLADVEAFASDARFPCLVKPLHARFWTKVPANHSLRDQKTVVAGNKEQLFEAYKLVEPVDPRVVLQEVIEGPDSNKYVYLSCWGEGGVLLGSSLMGAYRAHPSGFGSCSTVYPVHDAAIERLCEQFLNGMKYSGFCEIELKKDHRDGSIKMIEANPRYRSTSDAAQYAGVDIAWLHYQDLLGIPVKPLTTSVWNCRHVHVLRELGVMLHRKDHPGFTWGAWLKSMRPPVYFLDWDWRDPGVAFATVRSVWRSLVDAMRSFLFRRT